MRTTSGLTPALALACVAALAAAAAAGAVGDCGGSMSDPSGTFSYMRDQIPAGIMCRWTINVPDASSITLTFDSMFLSKSGRGCNQMLVVATGDGDEKDLQAESGKYQICAKRREAPPAPMTVDGGTVTLYLLTLKASLGKGFTISYEAEMAGADCMQPTTSSLGEAACDVTTEGGPWTVVQRRTAGDQAFDLPWADYQQGFGDVSSDYWLGLDALHELCPPSQPCRARVEVSWPGVPFFHNRGVPQQPDGNYQASYGIFAVGPESDNYRLTLDDYDSTSTAGMALTWSSKNAEFSTRDRDNDGSSNDVCSQNFGNGGWWFFDECGSVNLNGIWGADGGQGVRWHSIADWHGSMTSSRILIKREG